eukprot:symbB.v1.2.036136.t1/scaffold5033.1/size31628/1
MLREFCESCLGDGSVAYCSILRDKETGEPKGSAKLELTSPELVDRALKDALQVLGYLDINGLQGNLIIYNAAISACEKGNRWAEGANVLAVLADALQPDIISLNTCISACESSEWHIAIGLLEDVKQLSAMETITCNAAISSCRGQWSRALELVKDLSRQQLQFSVISFGAVTQGCDQSGRWQDCLEFIRTSCNNGLKTSVVLCGSGISSCETTSQWQTALMLFFSVLSLKLQLSGIAATAAMSSCERAWTWSRSLDLLHIMRWSSIQPNVVAVNVVLRSAAWPMALGQAKHALSVVSLGSLTHAFDRVGDWMMACHVLMGAFRRSQRSNAVVLGSVLSACEGNEKWQHAVRLLIGHKRRRLESNLVMRSACASAGISASAWRRGMQLLMHGDTVEDGVAHGVMVGAWKKGWCWPQALIALESYNSSVPAVSAAAAACAVSASWSVALEVAKHMQDAVASEVLSDACTKAGQGEGLSRVLQETNDNSCEKLPQEPDGRTVFMGGLSWDLDSEGLKAFAGQVGEVVYAAVFTNRETGKSKGSGKVQFVNSELALKAVEELNGRELLGREAPLERQTERERER